MKPNRNNTKKVVGIFQHAEALDIHFYNLAYNLSQNFKVYAFTLNKVLEEEQRIDLNNLDGVVIKNYHQRSELLFQPKRILARLGIIPRLPLYLNELSFLINREKIEFDYMIGVEKRGLALMNKINSQNAIKLYYSLELYESMYFKPPYDFAALRKLEISGHRKCKMTVVQDKPRAESMSAYNKLDFGAMKWIYLPVSIKGDANRDRSRFLYDIFKIEHSKKLILNFGILSKWRHSIEVANVLNGIGPEYQTILHGYGPNDVMSAVKSLERVIVSENQVSEMELNKLIASAHIGVSIYNNDDDNNKLTILSSERNARYCQNGVPFICLYCDESNDIYKELRYFEMVKDIKDIPAAIEKIDNNYEEYRENTFTAFKKYYSFDENFKVLATALGEGSI